MTQQAPEKALAAERLDRIRDLVRARRVIRLQELCREVGVSMATARRDLEELEKRGELRRVHGGAVSVESRLEEPLFDGIRELLDSLRGAGWDLGVATGKSQRGLEHCLAAHGLSDHFITLQTADFHPSKPHPAMLEAALDEAFAAAENAVMIGDTSYDIQMARAAGVRAIGVDWGYHTAPELLAAGAEAVAQSPEDLRKLLR